MRPSHYKEKPCSLLWSLEIKLKEIKSTSSNQFPWEYDTYEFRKAVFELWTGTRNQEKTKGESSVQSFISQI